MIKFKVIKPVKKVKKKIKGEISVKKGSGWFEKAMQELDKEEKKQ